MIPILYESNETDFTSNGLGRLRDCQSCTVTEERNGIYECDLEYPIDGAHFSDIYPGRIIGVEHDYTNDVQPFDIISASTPIKGVVTFHAVHISYRLTKIVNYAASSSGDTLALAFNSFQIQSQNYTQFYFDTDMVGTDSHVGAFDDVPKSIRNMLGGVEGSVIDTFGGELEFDMYNVHLWERRGIDRDINIRYGVNLIDFNDDLDYSESYNECLPYWIGQDGNGDDTVAKTTLPVSSGMPSYNGRNETVALDLSERWENMPTTTQLQNEALRYMTSNQTYLPSRNIEIQFINLKDTLEYANLAPLFDCRLCDTINVMLTRYGIEGRYKIVKTVYDVLRERYTEMELGNLSQSLADVLK